MDDQQCDVLSVATTAIASGGGNPYYVAVWTCLGVSATTFVVSTITGNYSQVDKLWSITPFLYAWMAVTDARTLLMALIATVWGVRLTANFYRRGGYQWPPWQGEEDYRWSHIRQGHYLPILTKPAPWFVFNLIFISLYQNILLLLIATPSFVAYAVANECNHNGEYHELNIFGLDGLATILMLTGIGVETIADNQQFRFQQEKYRQINAGIERKGEYADGFCQSGLFAILRKPNYAAEQSIWISFYIFSVAATGGELWNWSAAGWILLVILFQGSGALTEKLTLMKYPVKYMEYQKRVPLYVPRLFLGTKKKGD